MTSQLCTAFALLLICSGTWANNPSVKKNLAGVCGKGSTDTMSSVAMERSVEGMLIREVSETGVMAKLGFKPGDVLVKIDDQPAPTTGPDSMEFSKGSKRKFEFIRGGRSQTLELICD